MAKMANLPNDSVHFYMNELKSRVVVESGKPRDRFHLGKIFLRSLKDDPDFMVQIDGATGEAMTSAKLLERTVQCAVAMRNFGLQVGDVMVLMAPNHLEVNIPFQAALCLGVAIAAVDRTLTSSELQVIFAQERPKMVFCQSEKARDIHVALSGLQLDTYIITFDAGESLCSFADFLSQYGDETPIEAFKPNEFDPEDAIACLVTTSGSTGLPKACVLTHKNFAINAPYMWANFSTFPSPTRMFLMLSPIHWITTIINYIISPVIRVTRLQTSQAFNREHAYYLINTYRPTLTTLSSRLMSTLMKPDYIKQCDFTCFDTIILGGTAVPDGLIAQIKEVTPDTVVSVSYGMTELTCRTLHLADSSPTTSVGRPYGCNQYRIIDVETNEDIFEPYIQGELWVKGPGVFKMSALELENVIQQHDGVQEVAVTSVPDPELGDAPVACVVRRPHSDVTAQHISDFVKEMLPPSKQLSGVIFVDEIPLTAAFKVHRRKLKEIAFAMLRK